MSINDVILRMCYCCLGLIFACLFGALCTRIPQNNTLAAILFISAVIIAIIGVIVIKVFEWIAEFGRDNK